MFGCSEGSTEASILEATKNPMRYIKLETTVVIYFIMIRAAASQINH